MKITYTLSEAEIKEALVHFIIRHFNLEDDGKLKVSLNFHNAGDDPRESSYFSATVSE